MTDKKLTVVDVRFEGVDSWNRPVFKSESGRRYGSVNKLFNHNELDRIKELEGSDLEYFGSEFDCEPNGGIPEKFTLNIVWD